MTCWQSLFETVGVSRHLRELPSGNSSSHRDLLPAFDPPPPPSKKENSLVDDGILPDSQVCFVDKMKHVYHLVLINW